MSLDSYNCVGVTDDGGYIVVPEEDVMGLKVDEMNIDKRDENNTDSELLTKTDDRTEQVPPIFVVVVGVLFENIIFVATLKI